MAYDFFVAALKCPACGNITAANTDTNMQTKLRNDADLSSLVVGDSLTMDHDAAAENYLLVQPPSEPVRICHIWACPYCGHYPNWAEVVVRGGRIESIASVRFDGAVLDRLHYLDEDAMYFIADRTGVELNDLSRKEAILVLRRHLMSASELV